MQWTIVRVSHGGVEEQWWESKDEKGRVDLGHTHLAVGTARARQSDVRISCMPGGGCGVEAGQEDREI